MIDVEQQIKDWRPARRGPLEQILPFNWSPPRSLRRELLDWQRHERRERVQFVIAFENDYLDGQSIEVVFNRLAAQWQNETMFSSSLTEKVLHEAYQRIIGLGPRAVPLIIRELRKSLSDWFWALQCITGVRHDDVPSGDLEALRTAWLLWARGRGL
jgi:hypothetical protein